jgi:hypothetical protein
MRSRVFRDDCENLIVIIFGDAELVFTLVGRNRFAFYLGEFAELLER